MHFGLKETTIEKIQAVLAAFPQVESAILYGSRAKSSYKNGSDIDLTLRGNDSLNMDILYKIMEELDDLLLPYMIDLSIFASIRDAELIGHIERVGVVFYARDEVCRSTSKKEVALPAAIKPL
jgi:predicted nucleotidyltransferase